MYAYFNIKGVALHCHFGTHIYKMSDLNSILFNVKKSNYDFIQVCLKAVAVVIITVTVNFKIFTNAQF